MLMDYGWGMGFGGGLFMILFWIVVIIGVVFLVRLVMRGTKEEGRQETALDILKKRYAKGEISKEKFEEKKKDIG
jgi:putative membrane protein